MSDMVIKHMMNETQFMKARLLCRRPLVLIYRFNGVSCCE